MPHTVSGFARSAVLTSLAGFVLHVLDVDVVQKLAFGLPPGPSYPPGIMALALATSIEYGIGLVMLYRLLAPALEPTRFVCRVAVLTTILLMCKGMLLRQLAMDQLLGGPDWRALLRDIGPWWVWAGTCTILIASWPRAVRQARS